MFNRVPGANRMAGVTLVELIVAIVIVGIALAGLVAAYNRASIASADPLVTRQMLAIAESMMEEVMLKPFDGGDGAPGATRAQFDEIGDYANYSAQPVTDAEGNAIPGLERYGVSVAVDPAAAVLPGVSANDVRRVRVTVTHGGQSLALNGWRTRP